MTERLLVMNGQKIFQRDSGGGEQWETTRVELGSSVRPGFYHLDTAQTADRSATHDGQIIHADDKSVFQQCGTRLVRHERAAFGQVPAEGSSVRVQYDADQGQVRLSMATRARRL